MDNLFLNSCLINFAPTREHKTPPEKTNDDMQIVKNVHSFYRM
jgi:hypothetical protein